MKKLIITAIVMLFAGVSLAGSDFVIIIDDPASGHGQGMQSCSMAQSGVTEQYTEIIDYDSVYYGDMFIRELRDTALDTAISYGAVVVTESYFNKIFSYSSADVADTVKCDTNDIIHVSHAQSSDFQFASYSVGVSKIGNVESGCNAIEVIGDGSSSCETSPSSSIAKVGGILAYALSQNAGWDRWDARAALRQTASNYPNWVDQQGFGYIPTKEAVAAVSSFDLHGPVSLYLIVRDNSIVFKWIDFETDDFSETYLLSSDDEPAEDVEPGDDGVTTLYNGTDETYTWDYLATGTKWFFLLSSDGAGNYSKVYPLNKVNYNYEYEREATNIFVDNTSINAIQDGLSWDTCFNQLPGTSDGFVDGDTIYLKATNEIYFIHEFDSSKYYFKGGATGVGTTLNDSSKSLVTRAFERVPSDWSVYAGNTYQLDNFADKPDEFPGFYLAPYYVSDASLDIDGELNRNFFYSDSNGDIQYLTLTAGDEDSLSEGEWYVTAGYDEVYANFGAGGPPNRVYQVGSGDSAYSFTVGTSYGSDEKHKNLHIKYGYIGAKQWNFRAPPYASMVNIEISHHYQGVGIYEDDAYDNPSITIYDKFKIHDCEEDGIHLGDDLTAEDNAIFVADFTNFIIYDCGGDGVDFRNFDVSAGYEGHTAMDNPVKFHNGVIYNCGGKGINLHMPDAGETDAYFSIKNVISMGNTDEEFFVEDNANMDIIAGYNCHGGGTYGGKWSANKGSGNVESDPLMIDPANGNFKLKPTSPCIDAGTDVGIDEYFNGTQPVNDPGEEIGAYWYFDQSVNATRDDLGHKILH